MKLAQLLIIISLGLSSCSPGKTNDNETSYKDIGSNITVRPTTSKLGVDVLVDNVLVATINTSSRQYFVTAYGNGQQVFNLDFNKGQFSPTQAVRTVTQSGKRYMVFYNADGNVDHISTATLP